MLTCDGPALTFPQARLIEERFVREAAEIDDPDLYMRQVGDAVAQRVARLVGDTSPLLTEPHEPVVPGPRADVVAFVGGGDNGGDALYACATLADMGISVAAILLKRKRHSRALRAATASGVTIVDLKGDSITTVFDSPQLSLVAFATVWIDGIVGIGGKGALKGNLAEAVEQLNDFSFLTRPAVVSMVARRSWPRIGTTVAPPSRRATSLTQSRRSSPPSTPEMEECRRSRTARSGLREIIGE